jgi:hypothetical protein
MGLALPLTTGILSMSALLAVPFVFFDEAAYSMSLWSILGMWTKLRWIPVASGLLYLYELYSTLQANCYHDWGLWRALQACLFALLTYIRFYMRILEQRR